MGKVYDVIVLGAGPGGLSAGLYAGRARLSVAIIEKAADGGQIAITDERDRMEDRVLFPIPSKTIRDRKWKAKAGRL